MTRGHCRRYTLTGTTADGLPECSAAGKVDAGLFQTCAQGCSQALPEALWQECPCVRPNAVQPTWLNPPFSLARADIYEGPRDNCVPFTWGCSDPIATFQGLPPIQYTSVGLAVTVGNFPTIKGFNSSRFTNIYTGYLVPR